MFDLKVIHSVLDQLEEERGIPREKIIEAIEMALATAYKKEYGRKDQFVRAHFDVNTGKTEFFQVKTVVDPSQIVYTKEELPVEPKEGEEKILFNEERHMMLADAQRIKKSTQTGDEIVFDLEYKDDFGRIAAQTAKQVIIQKIREAEKTSVLGEYGKKEGEIISGSVQRIERGNVFIDLGRAVGMLPYEEQIPGENYKQGERLRMILLRVEETPKGVFVRLSRSHPKFLAELFKVEVPEITAGTVEIKSIAREAGSRSKIAVRSTDEHIDPIGSMVGQRGVRVMTVMSELGNNEKIDIIEWSEDPVQYIEDALSPAKVQNVTLDETAKTAKVLVSEDQQSLAIGKGGQNVRLAAKLTGWRIDIQSTGKKTEEVEGVEAETMAGITEPTIADAIDVTEENA
ncbi:MAG: transcription termination/antitermination protein NusA [Candidatus Taylorbacteria bacterium]|nr:transcription termination/antitermination protein NusA [Candidatus Taylorbacteria bacterium]